jgi:hypothetical protein
MTRHEDDTHLEQSDASGRTETHLDDYEMADRIKDLAKRLRKKYGLPEGINDFNLRDGGEFEVAYQDRPVFQGRPSVRITIFIDEGIKTVTFGPLQTSGPVSETNIISANSLYEGNPLAYRDSMEAADLAAEIIDSLPADTTLDQSPQSQHPTWATTFGGWKGQDVDTTA